MAGKNNKGRKLVWTLLVYIDIPAHCIAIKI